MATKPLVAIMMGSKSDDATMEKCADILREFNVAFEKKVLSAHRTPIQTADYVKKAPGRGIKVIIAAAGLAAHLPGVVAAHTTIPVIGVPIASGALNGVDALYAIVQMPPGIPVATVAIDGAKNAGILAVEILALGDSRLRKKLLAYRKKLAKK